MARRWPRSRPPTAFGDITPCNSLTTLQAYINTGDDGCKLGDKVFSSFSFAFSGGTTNNDYSAAIVPATNAVKMTAATADNSPVPAWVSLTFDFQGSASVAVYQSLDLRINYVVTVASPGGHSASITQVETSGVGARRSQLTSTNKALLSSEICRGGVFEASGTDVCDDGSASTIMHNAAFLATTGNPNLVPNQNTKTASASGLLDSSIGVYDYIQLAGGSTGLPLTTDSQAAVSTVTTYFTQLDELLPVPEPRFLLGIGGLFIVAGTLLRRKTPV